MSRIISPLNASGRCRPRNRLAIAGVEHEGNTHDFPVPARDLETVGAPTRVRAKRLYHAVVRATGLSASVPLKQHVVQPHDPIDVLVVHARFVDRDKLAVEKRSNPSIAVCGASINDFTYQGQKQRIVRLAIGVALGAQLFHAFDQI